MISVLNEKGSPSIVERALVCPPHSRLNPLTPEERGRLIQESVLYGHYEKMVDRESAYEKLKAKAEQMALDQKETPVARRTAGARSQIEDLFKAAAKSAAHAIGSQIGRQIIRGVLGSIFGGGRRR